MVLAWGPAVAWAAVLLLLNQVQELPSSLRPVMDLLGDKVVHVLLYTTLGVALAWGRVRVEGRVPHWLLLAVGYVYGALTEVHQSFIPGRHASIADWVANVIGVTLGYLVALGVVRALGSRPAGSPERGAAEGGSGYHRREAPGQRP